MLSFIAATLMTLLCVFLILLILIQRGKGGGLAGAFGGMGGQSAFGTKAGDAFMRITIVTAAIWFLFCIGILLAAKTSGTRDSGMFKNQPSGAASSDSGTGADAGAEQN
ncbi:MAG: preprotein translocase subunit SecG [Planctomycetaceae bacterium]|nr:preprotein translocase subunit SecG [Planctomycetaceae bacterium]